MLSRLLKIMYTRRLQEERYQTLNLTDFIVAGSEFDATWAMALGLHNASERVRVNDSSGCDHLPGELAPLEDFDYLNDRMGCVLRISFQQVNFRGITVSCCSWGEHLTSPLNLPITDIAGTSYV